MSRNSVQHRQRIVDSLVNREITSWKKRTRRTRLRSLINRGIYFANVQNIYAAAKIFTIFFVQRSLSFARIPATWFRCTNDLVFSDARYLTKINFNIFLVDRRPSKNCHRRSLGEAKKKAPRNFIGIRAEDRLGTRCIVLTSAVYQLRTSASLIREENRSQNCPSKKRISPRNVCEMPLCTFN